MNDIEPTQVTREELYKQVWETPMSVLAKQYGLSDRGLSKICARMKIPVPGRGYWARKAAGQHVIKYRLPAPGADTELEVRITPTPPPPPKPEIPPAVQEKLEVLANTAITIPEKLTSPHPVIRAWLDENKESRQEARKDFLRHGVSFGKKSFTPVERRQHNILNVLFKTLQKHGFIIKSERYQQAYLEYQGIRIDYTIREKQKQVRRPLTQDEKRWYKDRPWMQELQATGKLVFTIKTWTPPGLKSEWLEKDDNNSLENSLPEIINTLIIAGPLLVERHIKREEEKRQYQEEQHRRHLEEQARKKDWNQWRRFMEFSSQWEQANKIDNFISALEALNLKQDELVAGKTVAEWLKWAKEWARTYNPLLSDIETMFESISKVDTWTYNN